MNYRLNLLLTLITACFYQTIKAQNTNPGTSSPSIPLNTYLNNFVQPPPNAASLGKYADYPVGYFTGVPEISIPIYNLKDGGISLPISLSYHASGIHVSELASWVGLGWALNATGVINRTVRGAPDEGSLKIGASGYAPGGYYRDNGLFKLMTLPYPMPGTQVTSDPGRIFYNSVAPAILDGGADCEPDLYTFNFNGHTGKFVFDEKGVPRLLEDDNLKIIPVFNTSTSTFTSWMITTEDGVQYFFGENNAHEVVRPHSGGNVEDVDDVAPSAWYLTRIYNPNTNETATFNYANEGYSYFDLGPESQYYGGSNTNFILSDVCDNKYINSAGQVSNFISTTVQGLKLTSIVTNNYTIQFVANNVRTDISSTVYQSWKNPSTSYNGSGTYGPPCSLDYIKIYTNQNNTCIKQFALGHSYFNSTTAAAAAVLYSVGLNNNDNSDTQRLQLTSVTEISGDGTIQKPPYLLTYNTSVQLPRRLSYDQDHWGFSNNSTGNNNSFFTPAVTYATCTINSPGAIRHPKWPDMSAFTLTGIQDPLGVTTSFLFSPNSANNTGFYSLDYNETPDTLVGGLRIQQIKVIDNVTGVTKVRSFNYSVPNSTQPGGTVIKTPTYIIAPTSEYWQDIAAGSTSAAYQGYYGPAHTGSSGSAVLRQSQSIVPMQDANGNQIVYPYVKETLGQYPESGYTQFTFSLQSESSTNPAINSRLDFSNYGAFESMSLPATGSTLYTGYFGTGYFNDTTANPLMLPVNLALNYCTNEEYLNLGYPFAPQQVDIVSGKLVEQDTYDSSNNLLETVTNIYSPPIYHENFWIRGLKAYVENFGGTYVNNGVTMTNTPGVYNALTFYKLHTGISHLASTIKKTYNGSSFVTEETDYAYESAAHTLKTSETTTTSQGDVLINKTYYSFDYASAATTDNVFGKMRAMNLLEPVSTQSWKNGNLVSQKVTQFYDFAASSANMFINPINVYTLETALPLTPAQAAVTTTWSGPLSTLLPNSYLINKVNFSFDGATGRMTSQQLTNDKSQGVQWSSRLELPVAIVDNATNTTTLKEFYYEGFEESTSGQLYTGNGHTGTNSVLAPYTVTWTLPNTRSYVISYWYLSGGVWQLQAEQPFTGSLALTGGTAYDDIRIHPVDAEMTNYTYDASGDLTSTLDPKGLTTYYEYDSFQRLKNVRDKDKNIVKSICYNYAGQANGCYINQPSFTSAAASGSYNCSCQVNYNGSAVTYTVPAGQYTSNISQADANAKAQADVTANGQNYANLNGTCSIQTVGFTLTNSTGLSGFQAVFTGSGVTSSITLNFPNTGSNTGVQVPVGTYSQIYIGDVNSNPHSYTYGSQTQSSTHNATFTGPFTVATSGGNPTNLSIQ